MSSKKKKNILPEWSYPVDATEIGRNPVKLSISPDKAHIPPLEKRLHLLSLENLKAELSLARDSGQAVLHVTGHIDAKITQSCVVTLEPIASEIHEDFEAWFADPAEAVSFARARQDRKARKGGAEMPMLDESEDPEAIIDGKVDLGELVVQHLSLAIDPYPHKEGVHFEVGDDGPEPDKSDFKRNPFAALKDWKNKL